MQNSQDARKAKLYGKIGKLIVQAVKAGGTDTVGNARLKDVLKQAQQASVPKDIIERNIKRASDKSQADFQEVSMLTKCLTTFSIGNHITMYTVTADGYLPAMFTVRQHHQDGDNLLQVTYEAYGAGGTGFVMECLTDNLNRSASEIRAAVMKAGGKMADPGSVMFNFQRQGQVFVSCEASEDQVHASKLCVAHLAVFT